MYFLCLMSIVNKHLVAAEEIRYEIQKRHFEQSFSINVFVRITRENSCSYSRWSIASLRLKQRHSESNSVFLGTWC
jgi:hypothetical protein